MPKAVLDIPITSPEGSQKCLECAECVRQRLLNHPGIHDVSVHSEGDQARVSLNYDAQQLTLGQLEREVRQSGGCFSHPWGQAVIPIDGMVSPQSEQLIESALNRIPGVMAIASYPSKMVRLEFDKETCPVPAAIDELTRLGYRIRIGDDFAPFHMIEGVEAGRKALTPARKPLISHTLQFLAANPELAMPVLGGIFLFAAFVVHSYPDFQWLRYLLLIASFACSSRYTGLEMMHTLRQFRSNIDVLMFVAAAGAVLLGKPEEGALLLFLFGLGTAGENMAMDRARRAIQSLAELAPDTAILRDRDGRERIVRAADLQVGDEVVVRPFARLPADGMVVSGNSSVDQSPITGESIPVEKDIDSGVFAGTINGDGTLVVSVSHRSADTKLAKIIKLVAEAQTTKSPTQVLTDRVERWYVPAVLVTTTLLLVIPTVFAGGLWSDWFYRAMAFLTAASPCALAIGTPAAVLSGIARAARGGVLIKGGVHLENLGRVRAMAFDKTGTLTRGKPAVTDVIAFTPNTRDVVLRLTASLEQEVISHPLAAAIVAEAAKSGLALSKAQNIRQLPGVGALGEVDGMELAIGKPSHAEFSTHPLLESTVNNLESGGKTVVVIKINGQPAGVIALADEPRKGAPQVITELRKLGISRSIMLTGDNARVADAIARQIGIDEYHAGLMPEEKVERLRSISATYGRTAMVGDGVNDAPALATATVGIAMGGVGTDVALETADVALMADALEKLPEAIGLSRFSRRIIMQNLCIALGVILLMAPASALGLTSLGIAVVAHEGSTVLVVLNALRLLVYRKSLLKRSATSKVA